MNIVNTSAAKPDPEGTASNSLLELEPETYQNGIIFKFRPIKIKMYGSVP
jgi:hypothetical protein